MSHDRSRPAIFEADKKEEKKKGRKTFVAVECAV